MSRFYHVRILVPIDAAIEAMDEIQARRRGLDLIGHSQLTPVADGLIHASIGVPTCLAVKEIKDALEEPAPEGAWT
jgi:hypothetical protein